MARVVAVVLAVFALGVGSLGVGHAQEMDQDEPSSEVDEYVAAQALGQPARPATIIAAPVGMLVRDAATRMGDDPARVRVTWGDSSLGCPGVSAPEHVKTAGFLVTIIAGGHLLDYRTDDVGNRVVLCTVQPLPNR